MSMRSTKRFMSSSLPKHRHPHAVMVLPPRSHWDTIQSASYAIYNLFFYPSYRDTFLQNVDNKIINPDILGQLEFGFFMSLALHHNLSSFHDGDDNGSFTKSNSDGSNSSASASASSKVNVNYFAKYNFDPLEFINGSSLAVEQFQECLYSVDRKLISLIEREIEKDGKNMSRSSTGISSSNNNEYHENDEENTNYESTGAGDYSELEEREKMIERIVNQQMEKLVERTGGSVADTNKDSESDDGMGDDSNNDEYSDEYMLQQMTSKQLLDSIQKQFVSSVIDCYMNDRMRMKYILDSGKVLNVSLIYFHLSTL